MVVGAVQIVGRLNALEAVYKGACMVHSFPEYLLFLDQIKHHAAEMKAIHKVRVGSILGVAELNGVILVEVMCPSSSASKASKSTMNLWKS